jgi:hypothetical protein
MGNIEARHCVIKNVALKEANYFLDKYHPKGKILIPTKMTSYGLYSMTSLLGIVQFCSPQEEEMKKRYTSELVRVCFKRDMAIASDVSGLIDHYKNRHHPTDFFIHQTNSTEAKDIFRECGMTLVHRKEEGDSLYEWVNPHLTFYTYKITALDSDKYYYGVSHVKKENATKIDCLTDEYYGSGGQAERNKFLLWKKKHRNTLQKTILGLFERKSLAFEAEDNLVGSLWKTDKLCLNSVKGGTRNSGTLKPRPLMISEKDCPIHGVTKYRWSKCIKCSTSINVIWGQCSSHGHTKFANDKCLKCKAKSRILIKNCPKHGMTSHNKNTCAKCHAQERTKLKECSKHGQTMHNGSTCSKCFAEEQVNFQICVIHGLSKFRSSSCYKCATDKRVQIKKCTIHGLTKYSGDKCYMCFSSKRVFTQANCPIHGIATFEGERCISCGIDKISSKEDCPVHGIVKHRGGSCCACNSEETAHKRFSPEK